MPSGTKKHGTRASMLRFIRLWLGKKKKKWNGTRSGHSCGDCLSREWFCHLEHYRLPAVIETVCRMSSSDIEVLCAPSFMWRPLSRTWKTRESRDMTLACLNHPVTPARTRTLHGLCEVSRDILRSDVKCDSTCCKPFWHVCCPVH